MMKSLVTKKSKLLFPYLLAVVCTTAFFSFEFVPVKSLEYKEIILKHKEAKKKRTKALNKLKESTKGSPVYSEYLKEKRNTDKLWKELKVIQNNNKFLGFTNIQQFLGEFGWVFGLFIYSLFNLFRSYTSSNKEYGYIFLHSVILGISCFYLLWIFQPYQDIPKIYYYLMAILSGVAISFSVHLMSLYNFSDIGKLQKIIRGLFDFILIDSKEKDLIKDEKKDYYKKKSLDLVKNALDNE